MESQVLSEVCSDAASGHALTPLISRWSESANSPFAGESPQLGLEDGVLSAVDSSAELSSLDLEAEMNGPSSSSALFDISGSRRDVQSEINAFPLLDAGGELDLSFMSSLVNYTDHQQLDALQQFLHLMESSAKCHPQDTPLSSEYLAKLLVPSAFDNQTAAPTIMTPALLGPIFSSYSVPTIMPGVSQGNVSFQPPSLAFISNVPSPDSLPPTPNLAPQPLPPLSCILPSGYPQRMYPMLPAQEVSSMPSGRSGKLFEKKSGRKRAELSSSCQDGRPSVKKSKGGGRAGQIKFKKTENQLAVLRTYFSINKMPPREAIHKLSEITELTFQEVRNWFRNARLRYKDPMQPTGDLSLFRGMPGIPEHLLKQSYNSQPTNGSFSQPHTASHHRPPQKSKAHDDATGHINTNNVATGGARRSERIRSGWRSAATMAALLEAEKYQLSNSSLVDTGTDCLSCNNACHGQSTRKSTRAQSSIPAIKVTQDEKEKPLPFKVFQLKPSQQHDSTDTTLSPTVSKGSALSPVQLTPPTTPSTSTSFMDESLKQKEATAACQIPPGMFHVVKDRFVKSFTHQPPNSKERNEMLKALVHELDVKEKASLHVMVSHRLDRSMSAGELPQNDIKDRARDAWEKLEDLFKTTPDGNRTNQTDRECQSSYTMDKESPDIKTEVVDEDMFEGLKGMFQFHRDYLHAVWKLRNSADVARRCCGRKSSMSTDSDGSLEA